jgi:molybdopterin-guanine dinucleotide biosynthesis protein A
MHKIQNAKAEIACAIIAGGQNKRMGRHKAFLSYNGKIFIELIREHMKTWFDEVFIVTNKKEIFSDDYGPVFEDIIPDKGPLGALYTALTVTGAEYVFCVACDMPNPNDFVIARLIQASTDKSFDCLVPQGAAGPEPLFAIYRKSVANLIKDEIVSNWLKVSRIFEKCNTNYVDVGIERERLININTPGEYLQYSSEIYGLEH